MTTPGRAVVLGGGLAGMLAAHVLSRHLDSVTVVERDELPDGPEHRKGQPQARHVHLLWSSGARIIESMLPGVTDRLMAVGARHIGFQQDLVTLTSHGWQHRFPASQFAVMCSRPLLDWVIRSEILKSGRITVRQGTEVLALAGTPGRVTGVQVRAVDGGDPETIEADLVVDATGRSSRMRRWLTTLGLPAVEEDILDAGIAYATRVYAAPEGATDGFPAVNVAADHRTKQPGRFGVVYPIEDNRWMVTLSVTRGADLPKQEDEFLSFAQRLRHPLVADLIAKGEPLTPVFGSHAGANQRLYPERHGSWPEGLLLVGDSLAAFNPIYGHGMSSAARAAEALDRQLPGFQLGAGATREVQRAISEVVDDPWIMATSRDIGYPNCRNYSKDPRLAGPTIAQMQSFGDLITSRAIRAQEVCRVVNSVMSLSAPQSELGSSAFLQLLHRDPMLPELTAAPLTTEELDLVGLDTRSTVGP